MNCNLDQATIVSFGDEWSRSDQQVMSPEEAQKVLSDYFPSFPFHVLPPYAEGFDMGCGSCRWARFVAPRVGLLHCIDSSSALDVPRQTLSDQPNVQFHQASVSASGFPRSSQLFGYSLGMCTMSPIQAKLYIHALSY